MSEASSKQKYWHYNVGRTLTPTDGSWIEDFNRTMDHFAAKGQKLSRNRLTEMCIKRGVQQVMADEGLLPDGEMDTLRLSLAGFSAEQARFLRSDQGQAMLFNFMQYLSMTGGGMSAPVIQPSAPLPSQPAVPQQNVMPAPPVPAIVEQPETPAASDEVAAAVPPAPSKGGGLRNRAKNFAKSTKVVDEER